MTNKPFTRNALWDTALLTLFMTVQEVLVIVFVRYVMTVHYSSSCSFHLTLDAIPVHLDGVPCLKQSVQARTNNVCSWVLILFKLYWSSFVFVHVMFLYMTVQGRSTYFGRRSRSLRRSSRS